MVAFDTITNAGLSASTATTFDTIVKAGLSATEVVLMGVTLGPDVNGIEPYTTVHIDAVVTNGVGATLLLEQTGGQAASISGTAPNWTYKAPATLAQEGSHLTFRVTATLGGQVVIADLDHYIYPNTLGYYNASGQMVPAQFTNTVDELVTTPPFPDSGVFPDTGVRLRS